MALSGHVYAEDGDIATFKGYWNFMASGAWISILDPYLRCILCHTSEDWKRNM